MALLEESLLLPAVGPFSVFCCRPIGIREPGNRLLRRPSPRTRRINRPRIQGTLMSIELKIPEVGESVREVQIGRWLKHEGDTVAQDENVVELETDKASMELPAPAAGVLGQILKKEGDMVAVGEVIGYLESS